MTAPVCVLLPVPAIPAAHPADNRSQGREKQPKRVSAQGYANVEGSSSKGRGFTGINKHAVHRKHG